MENEIVTCINNEHALYKDSFKRKKIKVGKSYKCIDELVLTALSYYLPEFAALPGITIKSHVGRFGWVKPCLPKECFRIATKSEIRKYKMILILNMPFRYMKILLFKVVYKVDRIARKEYYKKMNEEFF